ncbi:ABC transporter, substrate-binding protein (cluster 10, nitrate/sulfonate/bicarbonate) [Candidatus Syntrophocurvum alkaliphilum]|uniref:ABC transporter, substrate-binding protein (Cluster 10, nitrate/sulfonate/bicarbonate) n=1 Tax=Candidatus Syntrophocurvum alkaliphilum TaxID=2293317 RepID=A0A6I6D9I4_9FIRM|nr:ABC transporter substrate-binding protein [Candidatus Syntrophocurvum alkaliphilum]QGT99117.1 ABC transporter, substrate-binding protein (cluster 10, nitrate/sulfonate/bicarbonate) [Candidatus Syntrophocurvum alkaliphilum]
MRRLIYLLFAIIIIVIIVWGTGSTQEETEFQPTILNPLGPTVIPVAGITGDKLESDIPVDVHFYKNTDEAIAMLSSDSGQFAVLPVTAAANIYNSGIDITMLGVYNWKVFYMVASNEVEFNDWGSLKEKTVYTPIGRGQTADILMRFALSKQGVDPESEVEIQYAPPQEIVTLFQTGKIDYAALPEPFASLAINDGNGEIVLDLQEYWGKINETNERIPITGLFVKNDFLDSYPQETQEIVQLFDASINWSNANVDKAIEVSQETLPIPQPIMKDALTRIDFYYVPASRCQEEVDDFLRKMQELYPQGIRELPDERFYAQ